MNDENPLGIDDILAALRTCDGTYPRDMVQAAVERREAIAPRLMSILEEVIADPEGFLENEDRFDHIFALMLLGHFKATEAHLLIVQVFSLKPETVDDLFGDHITLGLPAVLLRTSGGNLHPMRIMARDRALNIFCRIAAVRAMAYAVAAGIAPREAVLTFIASLFEEAGEEPDPIFLSLAALSLRDLYPAAHMDLIEKAYAAKTIDPEIVAPRSFERALAEGEAFVLAQHRAEWKKNDLADIHAAMSWWACFNENDDWAAAAGPQDLIESGLYGRPQPKPAGKTDKDRQKSRRKTATASRRKNRKR